MSIQVMYTTSAIAIGGREGTAKTTDGSFEVKFARPKELGGNGQGNNPEQLFAAGYSACFLSSLQFAASQEKRGLPPEASVQATVGIGTRSEGGFGLEVTLDIKLPGLAKDDARSLAGKAHQVCPYSNATRNNVAVRLNVL